MTVVLLALTAWRATRLLVEDDLLARPRDWLGQRATGKLADFVYCPHCVSVWVSAALVAVAAQFVSVPQPLLVGGAVAAVCSLIADFRPEHHG